MLHGKGKAIMITGIGLAISMAALCGMMAVSYKNMERVHQKKADAAILTLIAAEEYQPIVFEKEGDYRMIRSAYLAIGQGQEPLGCIALLAMPGYNGLVEVDVAIAMDGETILNMAVNASNETEGLGSKAGGAKFTEQFLDKKAPLDFTEVQAVSGATITSTAVLDAVNLASTFTKEQIAG